MSDSLSRLVEAVRSAGVDIAPGYCEYVRLAFAIANDAARQDEKVSSPCVPYR